MWIPFIIIFLAIQPLVSTKSYGWDNGIQYKYEIRGRSLAALHQVKDQYVGIIFRGTLRTQLKAPNLLSAQLENVESAEIHRSLPEGWTSDLRNLDYRPMIANQPFEISLKKGVVHKLQVNGDVSEWDLNFIKSIVSQLQVDLSGENLKKSRFGQMPRENKPFAAYKTNEDSIYGPCETSYTVSPISDPSTFQELSLSSLENTWQMPLIDIVKTRNFDKCSRKMDHSLGLTSFSDWDPKSQQKGNFLSRTSMSRIIVAGSPHNYTILSSVTTNKIIVSPLMYNTQKGSVVTKINITLNSLEQSNKAPSSLVDSFTIKSLAYKTSDKPQKLHEQRLQKNETSRSSSSDESDEKWDCKTNYVMANIAHYVKSRRGDGGNGANGDMNTQPRSDYKPNEGHWTDDKNDCDENENIKTNRCLWLFCLHPKVFPIVWSAIKNKTYNDYTTRNLLGQKIGESFKESSKWESEDIDMYDEEFLSIMRRFKTSDFGEVNSSSSSGKQSFIPHSYAQNSNADKEQGSLVNQVVKLATTIGFEIRHPEDVVQKHTLSKFTKLYQMIQAMNEIQMREATQVLYFNRSLNPTQGKDEDIKEMTWITFQNAVAESGSYPALVNIKDWILSKKLTGTQAADALATLAKAARHPDNKFMDVFFNFVKNSAIAENPSLNGTALLSFTDLFRKAVANKKESKARFPLAHPDYDPYHVIRYLEKTLRQAIAQNDTLKTQIYIRALGNTAHPKILQVFRSFFRYHWLTTKFQRFFMVSSLNNIAKSGNKETRSFLYDIYKNTNEPQEMRVAAVLQLMKTNPDVETLQRMAQFTNEDESEQVNSVVQSAILEMVDLKGPFYSKLAAKAKSAANLLTRKTYGLQYSRKFLFNYLNNEENLGYFSSIAHIGSEDSLWPKSFVISLYKKYGGYNHHSNKVEGAVSSIKQLLDTLFDQLESTPKAENENEDENSWRSEFTMENIMNRLNIRPDSSEPLEGNVLFRKFGTTRFIPFDKKSLLQLPTVLGRMLEEWENGQNFNMTKLYDHFKVELEFPTELGLPFIYSIRLPTLVKVEGAVKIDAEPKINPETPKIPVLETFKMASDVKLTYAYSYQAKIGFATFMGKKYFLSGLNKNILVNVPISVKLDAGNDGVKAEFKPMNTNEKHNLFYYSLRPYTNMYALNDPDMEKEILSRNYIQLSGAEKHRHEFGKESTGFSFQIRCEGDKKNFGLASMLNSLNKEDPLYNLVFPLHEKDIKNHNFSISFDPTQSTADTLAISVSRNVSKMWATFEGKSKTEYTLSMKSSETNPLNPVSWSSWSFQRKSDLLKPMKIAANLSFLADSVPSMNFIAALKKNITAKVRADLEIEDSTGHSHVTAQGKLWQSAERVQYLEKSYNAKQCNKDMKEDNYILPACRNATYFANSFDQYSISVKYDTVSDSVKKILNQFYGFVKYFEFAHFDENVLRHNTDKTVKLRFNLSPDLRKADVSIVTPESSTNFERVPVPTAFEPVLIIHPTYAMKDRFLQRIYQAQYYATCAVDKSAITTFNNRTYKANLENAWHVMATPVQDNFAGSKDENNFAAVLVKPVNNGQKMLKIILANGKYEIELEAFNKTSETFRVNNERRTLSSQKVNYILKNKTPKPNEEPIAMIYQTHSKEVFFAAPQSGISLKYDGTRVMLIMANRYRGSVRGLCGTFSGDQSRDLIGPWNQRMDSPQTFVTSYALQNSSPIESSYLEQNQQEAVPERKPRMISKRAANPDDESPNSVHHVSCTRHRFITIQQNDEICFSLWPIPVCLDSCRTFGTFKKQIGFFCNKKDDFTLQKESMVKKGYNPDVDVINRNITMTLPKRCMPASLSSNTIDQ